MYKITIPTVVTNGHFNKEKTLKAIKHSGAQRIALAIDREVDYAFSSPENLKLLKELIKYYKENGLEVLVWLGETFGHSGQKQTEESKYVNIRNIDFGDTIAFCPLDEKFKADFCTWVQNVAKCGADMIMLDDDFRLTSRGDQPGCCCPLHMKKLEEELGESVDEKNLKKLVFDGGKNKYRSVWLKTQGESMKEFAAALRKALDEVNPNARLGFCCCIDAGDYPTWSATEMAKIMAGKTKPFMRTIGAPYWYPGSFRRPGTLSEVIEIERMQLERLRDEDIDIFTEGDSYPRPRNVCAAAYLECFDMILRADGKTDGILKYMLDYVADADYETGYIDAHVDNSEIYKAIDEAFSDKECVGVRPYNKVHLIENEELDANREWILSEVVWQGLFRASLTFAGENFLPTAHGGNGVNILFGENAKYISKEELKNGNIIDLAAAKNLISRGIDVGIKEIVPVSKTKQKGFTDVPNEYHIDEDVYTRLDACELKEIVLCKENVRMVSQYKYGTEFISGTFEYENADGMRFFVYSVDMRDVQYANGWIYSYAGRRSLLKSIPWLGKGLDAYADGNYPYLYTIAKKNENELAVGLWNLFADKIKNSRIRICNEFKEVKFINCKGHKEGDSVILDTILYPYEFAGIIVK